MQLHAPQIDLYLERPLARRLFRVCILPARGLGLLTTWWADRLTRAGVGKPQFVIPNPLPPELSHAAMHPQPRESPRADGDLVVLTLSRLVPGKGVHLAIEALAELPDRSPTRGREPYSDFPSP